jgi:hypothetical protein
MKNDDTSYDRYRRDQAELSEVLEERRRSSEDAAKWETFWQTLRERGSLDEFDSNVRKLRSGLIRGERKAGKSLRDARSHADDVIARVRKVLIALSGPPRE